MSLLVGVSTSTAAKQWVSDGVQEGGDVCLGAPMGAEPP